jgi:site-specific DNA-methyltransferase (adenine-specific)
MLKINKIHQGDCLELMKQIDDKTVDMVLCDLPYGITQNHWDTEIDLNKLWGDYKRLIKEEGVIALTSSQPFSSKLIMSNLSMFKHEWIWIKNRGSNFANTIREPFKEHEHILIFANKRWKYNPQMQERTGSGKSRIAYKFNLETHTSNYGKIGKPKETQSELRIPSSWQKFNTETGLHPTQKPVELFKYLIKTYTDENYTVLDNCIGSGTTAIACKKTNRNFIGIELEQKYVDICNLRLKEFQTALYFNSDIVEETKTTSVSIPPTAKAVDVLGDNL